MEAPGFNNDAVLDYVRSFKENYYKRSTESNEPEEEDYDSQEEEPEEEDYDSVREYIRSGGLHWPRENLYKKFYIVDAEGHEATFTDQEQTDDESDQDSVEWEIRTPEGKVIKLDPWENSLLRKAEKALGQVEESIENDEGEPEEPEEEDYWVQAYTALDTHRVKLLELNQRFKMKVNWDSEMDSARTLVEAGGEGEGVSKLVLLLSERRKEIGSKLRKMYDQNFQEKLEKLDQRKKKFYPSNPGAQLIPQDVQEDLFARSEAARTRRERMYAPAAQLPREMQEELLAKSNAIRQKLKELQARPALAAREPAQKRRRVEGVFVRQGRAGRVRKRRRSGKLYAGLALVAMGT